MSITTKIKCPKCGKELDAGIITWEQKKITQEYFCEECYVRIMVIFYETYGEVLRDTPYETT